MRRNAFKNSLFRETGPQTRPRGVTTVDRAVDSKTGEAIQHN